MPDSLDRLKAALADRYTVERELGRGGTATVHLATDLRHNRPVAVKVLQPELVAVLGPERFLQEIQISAKLTHPHILPLHDSGEADGYLYCVMPYVEGESLRERLDQEKQLPLDDALRIAREVADALSYAHARGVIHRDIKPENILLESGHAVVADFGIARAINVAGGERLTEPGISLGTPLYMSPEQAAGGKDLDGRSDLYSLGCVLYEMLAGVPPFAGPTAESLLHQHLTVGPPSVTTIRPSVPGWVAAALTRALAKTPADRFNPVAQFSEAITPLVTDASSTREASRSAGRRRIPNPWIALFAALVVAVIGGVLSLVPSWERAGSVGTETSNRLVSSIDAEPLLPLSPTRVAVFPPTISGADSASQYAQWVSDALYRMLDGLGDLEGSDPNAVHSAVHRNGHAELGTDEGQALATYLGAGLFVLSRLSDIGGQVSVTSTLYRTGDILEPVQEAFAAGTWEEIGPIAERITRDLFAAYLDGGDYRLLSTAQIPIVSFEVLRAYLEGEQHFRERSVGGSREAFDRAIAADSSFSLAWFGRAMVSGQFGHSLESIDDALRHSSGLARRDSLLLEAARARYVDVALADELTREFVARHPGYTWGWHVRGLHLIWFTWRWGRSMSEARGPYERLLELEPDHPFGLFFLRWVASFEERSQERDSLSALYQASPGGFWGLYFEAERALESAEGTRRDSVLLWLDASPASDELIAGLSLENWSRADAATLLTDSMKRPAATRAVGFLILAFSEAGRGRWRAANDHLDHLAVLDPGLATANRGLLAAMPFLDLPDSIVQRARREVEAWEGGYSIDLGETLDWGGTLRFWALPEILGPHLKTYLLGLLAGRLGNTDELRRHAQALWDSVGATPCHHLGPDLALELRALAAMTDGNPSDALAHLERTQLDVCHPTDQNIPLNMRPFGRFLRGDLLAESGREEEALGWFSGFAPIWGTEEVLYQPFLYLRRAQLEEALGKQREALDHYRMFLQAWESADPHLQHYLDFARERATTLQRR